MIRSIPNLSFLVITITILFYLVYHSISGERGILALLNLSSYVERLKDELETIQTEKDELEHRVNHLKSDNLDLDLLEEQAKKNLGLSKKNEVVVYREGEKVEQ